MTSGNAFSPIDTGTAPEIYSDDLGDIESMEHTVCWSFIRQHGPERVTIVKVVTPISAVPSIAAQMIAAFTGCMTRRAKAKLNEIASYLVN